MAETPLSLEEIRRDALERLWELVKSGQAYMAHFNEAQGEIGLIPTPSLLHVMVDLGAQIPPEAEKFYRDLKTGAK